MGSHSQILLSAGADTETEPNEGSKGRATVQGPESWAICNRLSDFWVGEDWAPPQGEHDGQRWSEHRRRNQSVPCNSRPTEYLGADSSEEQNTISTGPAGYWDLWFPALKPRLLQALGVSKPLEAIWVPTWDWKEKGNGVPRELLKSPSWARWVAGYSQLLPETLR